MEWEAPQKPAEVAESRLITAMLSGRFAIGERLPSERELATMIGVTRPTLREALQRLARDGWIEIHHGRSTRIRDYWREGKLGVLGALAQYPQFAPNEFVPNLLSIRQLMAPAYASLAVSQAQADVIQMLQGLVTIEDDASSYAHADWMLHHRLTVLSGNTIFTLILNGFEELYASMARIYFKIPQARRHSEAFYEELLAATKVGDLDAVESITRNVMAESQILWQRTSGLNMHG